MGWQQSSLDMGRHIIGALIGVGQIGHAWVARRRDKTFEEIGEVCFHLRIGIFLDQQAGRGVLDEEGQQAIPLHPSLHLISEFIEPLATGLEREGRVHHTKRAPEGARLTY